MGYVDKAYLETQFKNYTTRASLMLAFKNELLKPDGTTITKDPDGTIHAAGGEEGTTDYNGLENKPQINNVTLSGNKTLEELGIQKKGNYVESTTLESYALSDDAAYSLELDLNETNYQMTIKLKNKVGTELSSKMIDFPVESMVVGAEYEDGQLKLTLQNGTSVDVDVSEMVGGLVPDSRTIADLSLTDDISVEALKTALDVPDGGDYVRNDDVEQDNIDFSEYFTS